MNQQEQIAELIAGLEDVQITPRMFFGDDLPPILNFIFGFNLACHAFGITREYKIIYNEVRVENGYPMGSSHPFDQMIKEGFSQDEIVQKILNMEIETWRRVARKLEE